MEHIPDIEELTIVAAIGVVVSVVLARLRLPTVAGLLLAGAIAGPHALALVGSSKTIEALAEIGVVLLLFSIGLELSLDRLRAVLRYVAVGGSLQVGLTIAAVAVAATAFGVGLPSALVYGFVFSLSSTAIVLRALAEHREIDAPHGRFIVGALLFQDLCVVPMVLLVPVLGGSPGDIAGSIGAALGKAALVVAGVVLVSRWLVPRAMALVDASRSREVFLLAVLAICLGTAWLTSLAGLSLALGAFLGGTVVAGTEFRHRALGDVLPLRDAFVSVFFVSLGMLFDGRVVLEHPLELALMFVAFTLGKGVLAGVAALAMRFPARAAWLAAVGLAQFGEFGFVLTRLGQEAHLVAEEDARVLLAAGIMSMFVTPLLVRVAPHLSAGERLLAPLAKMLGAQSIAESPAEETLTDHVVVVGYGVAGRLIVGALSRSDIRYVVLELNAETVRAARARGENVFYGDASSAETLGHAHLETAAALVIVANDPQAVTRVVGVARRIAPELPIVVRAHYLAEREDLHRIGASEVVAEEVETAVEIAARVLRRLEIPRNVIESRLDTARLGLPEAARPTTIPRKQLAETARLRAMKIDSVLVREGSRAIGLGLVELDLRRETGALAIAIEREGSLVEGDHLALQLAVGDVVFVVGTAAAVAKASAYLDASE